MQHQRNALAVIISLLTFSLTACSQVTGGPIIGTSEPSAPPSYPYPIPGSSDPNSVVSPSYPAPAYPAPWQPAMGDKSMQRGNLYIDEQEILVLESFPPQFKLYLKGNLPTPCHQLRVRIPEPDQFNRIQVEAYSLVKPGEICIQVLEPFEVQAPLEGLPSGHFIIYVNGNQVGEIDN